VALAVLLSVAGPQVHARMLYAENAKSMG
jgi:hypothetical protein